jgi:hypothetical protein
MQDWIPAGIVIEGNAITIGGLNPWGCEWRQVQDEPIELPHPAYPNQRHRMWVYEIKSGGRKVKFAAGELSTNVWGFYVPVG